MACIGDADPFTAAIPATKVELTVSCRRLLTKQSPRSSSFPSQKTELAPWGLDYYFWPFTVFLSTLAEKMTLKLNSWEIQPEFFFCAFGWTEKSMEEKKKIFMFYQPKHPAINESAD
ncbi:hypothetical protein EYF80_052904 [Liparis tanakae]|uniref:Uncharacterized protein n=1 Tax=Liparis tanakae TaxID=230148 RepID=A0A4Z2F7S0_9TELE|nr:hypothetical protein EYF80_052904 [Liparis tanakae]